MPLQNPVPLAFRASQAGDFEPEALRAGRPKDASAAQWWFAGFTKTILELLLLIIVLYTPQTLC